MQNMNFYYDFSGQKFDYPLSLSINQFDRQVFSRQSSLEISYVLRGSYEVNTELLNGIINEHELVIIAPYDIHMVKPCSSDSIILTVHLDFSYLPMYMVGDVNNSFLSIICNRESNKLILDRIKEQLGVIFKQIIAGTNNLFELNNVITSLILIASYKQGFAIEQLPLASKNHENYMKAILFIDQHYQDDIHLEDIADNLSFSISYTSRLFKKYAGISFVKYLAMVRIRHSVEALLSGKDSIEEIAFACGVNSSKAYTQAFKDIYGVTPSIYRKQFKQNLKYNQDKQELKMQLDDHQIALLEHLVDNCVVYQDEHVLINDNGNYIVKDISDKEIVVDNNQLVMKVKNC